MHRHSTSARDAGLRKVRSTTRWLAGGAAGLTLLFTAFTLPHSKGSGTSTTSNDANTSGSSVSSSNGGSSTSSSSSSSSSDDGFSTGNGLSSSSRQPVTHSGAS